MANSWIITTDSSISALVDWAKSVGGSVTVVAVGDVTVGGVDSVISIPVAEGMPAEAAAPAVAAAVAAADDDVIFASNGPVERVLAGAVAAALGAPVLTGVRAIDAGSFEVARYGGIALERVTARGPVVVIADGGAELGAAPMEAQPASAEAHPATVVSDETSDVEDVNLSAARKVVAAGRGFRSREDLHLLHDLAAKLGAEVAVSRPLAEGLGWFPHDRYVGATGQTVAPDLYVAVGISGQLHHTIGASGSKTIVVINDDPDSPYFQECDYGVVGDLYEVLPALTDAL